jgi:hypothetical protein
MDVGKSKRKTSDLSDSLVVPRGMNYFSTMACHYLVRPAPAKPSLTDPLDPAWQAAEILEVASFRERTGTHRPATRARLLHDADGIFVRFDVADRFVRSVHVNYQDPVSRDSCVEWFVQPSPEKGYFNFETNCGGTLLLHYCEPALQPKRVTPVDPLWAAKVPVCSSMPRTVEPEVAGPVDWTLAYFVPFALLEHYAGPLGEVRGATWRANFYKIGSGTSHPHWASWSPIASGTSFHQPEFFGEIMFL